MKITDLLLAATLLGICFAVACNKGNVTEDENAPRREYTITGTILDGTTNARAAHLPLEFDLMHTKNFSTTSTIHSTIGTVTTNDTGGFVFIYDHLNTIRVKKPYIRMLSQVITIRHTIPVNENIDFKYYRSSLGTFNINLHTDKPLDGDTLFLQYTVATNGNRKVIDTITSAENGLFKSLRVKPSEFAFYWGRGKAALDSSIRTSKKGFVYLVVEGDPIVNEVNVVY